VRSLLAQLLLVMAGKDLGYPIFIDANEKSMSVFVGAFRKSDVPGHHIGKSGCRQENCHATANTVCLNTPNCFCLTRCDVIN